MAWRLKRVGSGNVCRKRNAAQQLSAELSRGSSDTHQDGRSEPLVLKNRVVETVLEWACGAIGGKNSCAKKSVNEAWNVLVSVLRSPIIRPDHPLPASLISNSTDVIVRSKAYTADECTASALVPVGKFLELLNGKFAASFKADLEPLVLLADAALTLALGPGLPDDLSSRCFDVACTSTALLFPMVNLHPNPRKVWDAIVPKGLLRQLILAGFGDDGKNNPQHFRRPQVFHGLVQHVVFAQQHINALHTAFSAHARSSVDPEHHKVYAFQLIEQMQRMLDAKDDDTTHLPNTDVRHAMLNAFSWFAERYAEGVRLHRRETDVSMALSKKESRPRTESDATESQHSGHGVPKDAAFTAFHAMTLLIQDSIEAILTKMNQKISLQNDDFDQFHLLALLW